MASQSTSRVEVGYGVDGEHVAVASMQLVIWPGVLDVGGIYLVRFMVQ